MATTDTAVGAGTGADEEAAVQPHGVATDTGHGVTPRGLTDGVPRSTLHEGRFGRMFRGPSLEPLDPGSAAIQALVKLMRERSARPSGDNPKIPAGYTYLGQFVDHDITFDPVSQLQRQNDPDALVDFRTPRLDLDCLYGSGPADDPFMYWSNSPRNRGVKLLVGRTPSDKPQFEREDLPRNQEGRALIGDPRNDENIIVGQLQLLFIRFHNKVVDLVRRASSREGHELFLEAQRIVRWHFQWIVTHDFLRRIVGRTMAESVLGPTDGTVPPVVDRRFYDWEHEPFMPVEFSGAAYRFGHSMIRPSYDLNATVVGVPLFVDASRPDILEHLGGFRRLPAAWTLDWSLYFKLGVGGRPQLSRKIDTKLAEPLFRLPSNVDDGRHALAQLNLRRGRALGLPSGQAIAEAMGETPLAGDELGLDGIDLPAAGRAKLEAATPLWYYVLQEAEVKAGGEHLGPVGGRIVAEVLVGLLEGDPLSYLRRRPRWTPTRLPAAKEHDFTMADLVKFTLGD